MIAEVSSPIRQSYVNALSDIRINGVLIPVFDEIVNNASVIPTLPIAGSPEAYIVLQAQQESDNPVQTNCSHVINAYITVRIVTKYDVGGSKLLSENISKLVKNSIQLNRDVHKLVSNEINIQNVKLEGSQTYTENAGLENAFTKILQYNNIVTT